LGAFVFVWGQFFTNFGQFWQFFTNVLPINGKSFFGMMASDATLEN